MLCCCLTPLAVAIPFAVCFRQGTESSCGTVTTATTIVTALATASGTRCWSRARSRRGSGWCARSGRSNLSDTNVTERCMKRTTSAVWRCRIAWSSFDNFSPVVFTIQPWHTTLCTRQWVRLLGVPSRPRKKKKKEERRKKKKKNLSIFHPPNLKKHSIENKREWSIGINKEAYIDSTIPFSMFVPICASGWSLFWPFQRS